MSITQSEISSEQQLTSAKNLFSTFFSTINTNSSDIIEINSAMEKINSMDQDTQEQFIKLSQVIEKLTTIDNEINKFIVNNMNILTIEAGNEAGENGEHINNLKKNLMDFQNTITQYFIFILSGKYKKGSVSNFKGMIPLLSGQFDTIGQFVTDKSNDITNQQNAHTTPPIVQQQLGGGQYKKLYGAYKYKYNKYSYGLIESTKELQKYL
ncbi:hypothetical protein BMW23_0165 [Bodo saltans virus]|uniref:Uncharacterized protein n=1 Tax=Bodo saltans virus TaxID=2024608 RepID=A0A2H4UTM6_9VIRU|nr:hypothetical protein QJ851_gp0161 [Bodo saltans virus]ATZ80224.1 hypothetical protein BMW23_0165 [Bodo saltans virus]